MGSRGAAHRRIAGSGSGARLAGILAVGLAASVLHSPVGAESSLQTTLAERGQALLAALSESQRDDATWPFDDEEREDIHYAPLFLEGVALRDLSARQSSLTAELLDVALSPRGRLTVERIRALEADVRRKEGRIRGALTGRFRDPERYLLALFGSPSADTPWAFRFEGHHLSLNVTSVPGELPATTPLFLGAEPRRVPDGWPSAGVAVLGEEEQVARELVASLDPDQRAEAILPYEGGRGLVLGQVRRVAASQPSGLRRDAMSRAQQELVDRLLEAFIGQWSAPIAAARRSEFEDAGRDAIHFAWTEAESPAGAFYLRLQGPHFLIEIDNTTDGDHVHAVWHDLAGDFGDDLLTQHYASAHGIADDPSLLAPGD